MITPIMIPVPTSEEDEDTCPSCHKPEDIKEVCRHCGHEYIEEDAGFSGIHMLIALPFALAILVIACGIFLGVMSMIFVPMFNWVGGDRCLDNVGQKVSCYSYQQLTKDDEYTLVEAYGDEAKAIWGVIKRIY